MKPAAWFIFAAMKPTMPVIFTLCTDWMIGLTGLRMTQEQK
jgi:hypothetical protein